eukprot:TRINITY_DN36386_c0_g1_i1.p1 TRINITY_DN36386_c0_g1~~TRINITY_DN36386_c0_g1_i1.p1  ORF type:complete len:201 (-),score=44.46 TRINITY_DN36386_c0_g1_i1:28-630(-)
MIRRPPRSTQGVSSAASDVYKRQEYMGDRVAELEQSNNELNTALESSMESQSKIQAQYNEMKQMIVKNVLEIGTERGIEELSTLRMAKSNLEEELKDKEEYIKFLTEKPPFSVCEATPMTTELEGIKMQIQFIKNIQEKLCLTTNKYNNDIKQIWPHIKNIMLKQCVKADEMERKYTALTRERLILLNQIARLKQQFLLQ